MEKEMDNHLEELSAAVIGFITYVMSHTFGFKLLQVTSLQGSGMDIVNKCVNVLFGVVTACCAYLAVYLIKKYITKENK